jgi:hypothetical protein
MTGPAQTGQAPELRVLLKQASMLMLIAALVVSWSPQPAQARLITMGEAAAARDPGGEDARSRIAALVNRPDVRDALVREGVKPDDAIGRIAALSDAEVQALAAEMEDMPAGGSSILGALLVVFIVLLVTDILGYTKVFSFTKPIK